MLSTDWTTRANRLAVTYNGPEVRLDLAAREHSLINGAWEFEIQADGVSAQPQGDWSEICWVNDSDCDYLELEMSLGEGLSLQRQILLAREDDLLLLADVVVGKEARELSYRGRLKLADAVSVDSVSENHGEIDGAVSAATGTSIDSATSELILSDGKPRAMVVPLALNEWRSDTRGGTLSNSGGQIELQQRMHGRCLYAPLWFDLKPKRFQQSRTWRQLTIAEQLAAQPRDVAVGYRIQFGKRHWMLYRALTARANRTLLGVNLSTEFFVGRFLLSGETESILEVE